MSENPGAGWLNDPTGKHEHRYHDGIKWTEHVSDAGVQSTDPMPVPVAAPTPAQSPTTWRGRPWWHWVIAGFFVLAVISAVVPGSDSPKKRSDDKSTTTARQTTPTPAAVSVTAATLKEDGNFWRSQSSEVKTKIATVCIPITAKTPDEDASFTLQAYRKQAGRLNAAPVVAEIDKSYAEAEKGSSFLGPSMDDKIGDTCASAVDTVLEHNHDVAENVAQRRHDQAEASVEPGKFRTSTKLVKRFITLKTGDRVRSVVCKQRKTCVISMNTTVGDLGLVGDIVLGEYNRDAEAQVANAVGNLFQQLFSDKQFEQGTVTAWVEARTKGGKSYFTPALTVTCDKAADRKIDWNHITLGGFQSLCGYDYKLR